MRAFIVSDHEPSSVRVRQVLLREGLDCPADGVVALDRAAQHLARGRPELVVFVLPQDLERGLALGADAYIVKRKFDHEELLQAVRQIL